MTRDHINPELDMATRISLLTTLLWAALCVGPLATLPAQEFEDVTTVVAIEIPVQVIKDGKPVRGLTADDFEILEDKRPVAVTNFYAVEDGIPLSSKVVVSDEEAQQVSVDESDRTPSALPDDQRLFLIVYVDNFNIRPFNRNRVFRGVREFCMTTSCQRIR